MFQPKDTLRPFLIADWKSFTESLWQPLLAPAMLSAWKASTRAYEEDFDFIAATLNRDLPAPLVTRSIEAGNWLLESTRGAKYQGALGRLRQKVDEGRLEPHLPIVWAVTAALFQLTPAEMLAAEIGEEWHAAAAACAEPNGMLSFASLAHSALRSSNILQFSDVEHRQDLE